MLVPHRIRTGPALIAGLAGLLIAAAAEAAPRSMAEVPEELRPYFEEVETPEGTSAEFRSAAAFAVSATSGVYEDRVEVTWTAAPDLDVYFVVSRDGEDLTWLSSQDSVYADTDTEPLRSHDYAVVMVHLDFGPIEVGRDTGYIGFFAPANLVATDYTDLTGVSLTWEDRSSIEHGYLVRRDGVIIDSLAADTGMYHDATADPLATAEWCVTAYRTDGTETAQLGSVSTGSSPYRVAVEDWPASFGEGSPGVYAFTVDSAGFNVFDVVDPTNPVHMGSAAVPGVDVAQGADDFGYVVDGAGMLTVLHVYDPMAPAVFATEMTPGDALGVVAIAPPGEVGTEYVAVADGSAGVSFFYVGKGSSFLTQTVPTFGSANAVYQHHGLLYVADGMGGVTIIDVSDLNFAGPSIVGNLGLFDIVDVAVYGERGVAIDGGGAVTVIDVSDPTSPSVVITTVGPADDVEMYGTRAFVKGAGTGLRIIETAGGVEVSTLPTAYEVQGFSRLGDLLYVATGDGLSGELLVFDLPFAVTSGSTCDLGVAGTIEPPSDISATYGRHLDRTVISWTDNSEIELGFRVQSADLVVDVDLPPDTESYEDFAPSGGAEREYAVYALDPDGNPVLGGTATGIFGGGFLPAPTGVLASDLEDSDEYVRVTWNDTDDEDSYVIYRKLIDFPGDPDSVGVVSAGVTTFDDTTVPAEMQYDYTVVARTDDGGYSVHSDADAGEREDILPPANVSATDGDHETHTTITWENRSAKTVLFRILRDGAPIQTVTGTATSTEDPLGVPGQEYIYRVEAVSATGIASGHEDLGSRVLIAPTNVSAEDGVAENRIRIDWQDHSSAESGYRIYRDAVPIATVGENRTTYTDLTAVPGTSHTYDVAAYDALGESEYGTDTGFRNLVPPANLSASDGTSETEVILTWDDVSGAETGYQIRRDGVLIGSTSASTFIDLGGSLGTTYSYAVVAFDAYGSSDEATDDGYTAILAPGSLSASTTYSDRIVLSWTDESDLADEYRIYRDGLLLATLGGNSIYYEDTGPPSSDVTYTYCVTSHDNPTGAEATACADGIMPSTALTFGTMAVAASSGDYDNRVRVEWTSGDPGGLDEFEIYRDGQKIETVGATASSYNDFDAVPGAAHRYGVAGVNSSGTFLESGEDPGWIPADGAINGRITTRAGSPVDGVDVCLTPSLGQAISLDGREGHAEMPSRSDLIEAFTVEYWMKSSETSLGGSVFSYATSAYADQVVIRRQTSGNPFAVTIRGITASYDVDPYDGDWHHVAVAWDGTANGAGPNLWVYIDGVLEGQGSFHDGAVLNSPGTTMLGQNHNFDGSLVAGTAYRGLLDEVRVWNVARPQDDVVADMDRSLTGTEDGLVYFWPMSEGGGTAIADLTGNGVDGALEGDVDWTTAAAPLTVCAASDLDGNYALTGIRYGAATDFRVTPSGDGRAFDPAFTNITLDTQSPVANEINFNDVSAFTLSGLISYDLASSCGQPDVPLYVDDVLVGTSRADGTFAVTVQPGDHVLEPRLDGHTFDPATYEVSVSAGLAGLDFSNTTTRTLTGRIGGGCDASIGEWRFDLATENGCFATTIQADGAFELQLPPLPLVATVDQLTGVVPPPLDEADVLQFFQNVGSYDVDLTSGDQDLELVYKAPLTMQVTGFPAACGEFYDPESGVTATAAPVIAQLTSVPLTINVFEDYGTVQCPVDSGTVTIYDEIKDVADTPVVLAIVDGVASYTTIGNKPNVSPGRRDAQGNDRSFQKAITFAAEVTGQPALVQTKWALVTGDRPRTGTFVTATSEEIPLLILRDPPGDGSVSTLEQETTYSYNLGGMILRSITGSIETAIKAGFEFEAGTLFFSTENEVEVETSRGFEIGASASASGDLEFTVTTTEEFSTSDEQVFVGPDADLILGVAMNLLFAKTDVLEVDPATCQIQRSQTVRFGADADKPFETVYLYTTSHIANVVMPQLEDLAELEPDRAFEFLSYRDNWQDHLDLNDALRTEALENPTANRTFSAGAEYAYSHTTTNTQSYAWEVNVYTEDTFSTQIGFEIAGSGATTTLTAAFRSELSLGGGGSTEESITVGYSLADDDPGDSFTFDVANDPLYGTPVFGVRSGRSSCPLEAGTQERDAVSMNIEPPFVEAPDGGVAEYVLSITNDSPSDDAREYQLRAIQTSNPGGAVIRVNGSPLDNSVSFFIDPGQTHNATLTVERGPSQYFYEDLQVQVVAPCEYELWEAGGTLAVADTVKFSVAFDSPCSNISLISPSSGWSFDLAESAATSDTLSLLLDNFELAISETDSIQSVGAEYRRVDTDTWFIIDEVAAADVPVYPGGHALEGEPKSVSIPWDVSGVVDGQYEVRAFTRCEGGRVSSFAATGRIDRAAPQLFGDPYPADLVFSLGDRMGFRFDEAIDCETVNATSMTLEVVEAGGDTPVAVQTTCSGKTILITPTNPTIGELEGKTLRATARATLADLAGNPLGTDQTWTFTVAQSAFAWRDASVFEAVPYRAGGTVDASLVNGLEDDRPYELRNVAEWLTPDAPAGTVVAGQESLVSFSIADSLQVSTTYTDTLEAVSPSIADPQIVTQLIVRVDVGCVTPQWEMTASGFEYSMTAVVELVIDSQISDDGNDLVAAFVGGELRGLGSPVYVPGLDRHLVFMNVFSNRAAGENVRFRIYDDSDCRLYPSADNFLRFESDRRHGTPETPIVLAAVESLPSDIQAIPVGPGWTWFSLNLFDDLDMTVVSILGDLNATDGDVIKSQAGFAQYDDGLGWTGSLTELDVMRSFAIDVAESGTILHVGDPAQADIPIAIVDGWNWVGYPAATGQDVDTALSNLVATDGDVIKSQYGFAEYVASLGSWVGTLTTMEPGLGYKLHVDDALLSGGWLIYPIPTAPVARPFAAVPTVSISSNGATASKESKGSTASAASAASTASTGITVRPAGGDVAKAGAHLDTGSRPDWRLTEGRQFNMTIVARVSIDDAVVDTEGGVVGAFVGDELRGVGEVQYVYGLGEHVAFVMVHSNSVAGEEVTFRYYDAGTDAVLDVLETLSFEADLSLGSLHEPMALRAVGEEDAAPVGPAAFVLSPLAPNPARGGLVQIRWAMPSESRVVVRMYDVNGRDVGTVVDEVLPAGWYSREVDTSRMASGVYFTRMQSTGFSQMRKLLLIK